MKILTFTKIDLPYGWLGNMSRYPIEYNGLVYKTSEHLFQSLRFSDPVITEQIRTSKSPMGAKFVAKKYKSQMSVIPRTEVDLVNMEKVIKLKLEQHTDLNEMLSKLTDCLIIEDVSSRNTINNRYWGMALVNGQWVGENNLGKIWMKFV